MNARTCLLACVAALVLGGCTTGCGYGPGGCGPGGYGSGASGPGGCGPGGCGPGGGAGMGTGMGMGGMGMGGMGMGMGGDPAQTCAMYRQLTEGKSPEAQREAIEARMQSMHGGTLTPDQLRMRREMMERNCAGAPAAR